MNLFLKEELVALLSEAPLPLSPARDDSAFPVLDNSRRARTTREILRISDRYGWRAAIVHFLDTRGVSHLSDLSVIQLDDLLERMHGYIDAVETGSSAPDCPPAT